MLKAVKFTEEDFKGMICDEDITLRGVTDYHPKVEEDLSIVDFDTENMTNDPEESFTGEDYVKYLGYNELDNGMSFVGYMAGGDWEYPLYFIIYFDGEELRAYVPVYGNSFNYVLNTAYGSEGDTRVKELDLLGVEHLKKMYRIIPSDLTTDGTVNGEEDPNSYLGVDYDNKTVLTGYETPNFEKMMLDIKSNIEVV